MSDEIRMAQTCVIGEKQVEWNCSMDVETSRLPVFRHRLTVPEQIAISDVKVAAGEANRLASWHRRGDQLVILLREGTTGLHVVTLTGSQELRPDDTQIRLSSPRVQDAQILESSMTLLDQHPEGLTFLDPGDAIPDPPINTGDLLQPGQEVRFQIVGESKPVVLQRLNPVDPRAEVVAFRSPDRIAGRPPATRGGPDRDPRFPPDDESCRGEDTPHRRREESIRGDVGRIGGVRAGRRRGEEGGGSHPVVGQGEG